jgi:hypothetical protein
MGFARLLRGSRMLVAIAAAFGAGVVASRTTNRPVAGSFPDPLPRSWEFDLGARHEVMLKNTPLVDATEWLSKQYGIEFRLDQPASERWRSYRISMTLPRASTHDVLELLQMRYNLFASMRGAAIVLEDTPPTRADMPLRAYGVTPLVDLLIVHPMSGLRTDDPESARDAAVEWIERETRMQLVDTRYCEIKRGRDLLLVRTTPLCHARIAQLLNQLTRALTEQDR